MVDHALLSAAAGFAVTLGVAMLASAQPGNSSTDRTTPGVLPGTSGTTYGLPGGSAYDTTPGGTVPMGAATQDKSNMPTNRPNYNNSSNSTRRPSR